MMQRAWFFMEVRHAVFYALLLLAECFDQSEAAAIPDDPSAPATMPPPSHPIKTDEKTFHYLCGAGDPASLSSGNSGSTSPQQLQQQANRIPSPSESVPLPFAIEQQRPLQPEIPTFAGFGADSLPLPSNGGGGPLNSGGRPTVETFVETKYGAIGTVYLSQASRLQTPKGLTCRLIISACSSCVIRIQTAKLPEGVQCQPCRDSNDCFELSFEEHSYNRSKKSACETQGGSSQPGTYVTESYKLQITYQRPPDRPGLASTKTTGQDFGNLFPLKFEVLDNTVIRRGRPVENELVPSGFIESPNFPEQYRQGVNINYTLINEDDNGSVRLVFADFHLHFMSQLVIYDTNNQKLVNTLGKYGTSGRPTPVQSSGPVLYILFQANHYIHEIGFRAQYTFVKDLYWPDKPTEDCDKIFHDKGGVITMPSIGLPIGFYVDCVWIIEKSKYALPLYDQLFLKLHDFSIGTQVKPVQLEIRRGRTSLSPEEVVIFGPLSKEALARMQPAEGFTTSLTTNLDDPIDSNDGFYLRLTGTINSYEGLEITFAQFYRWATAMCSEPNDFHCSNGRCIRWGRCDTHDHCGDYSDEERCGEAKAKSQTPPPVMNEFSAATNGIGSYTMTIILVAGLIGVTLVMLMVAVIVARVYRQRLERRMQAQQQAAAAISATIESNSSSSSGGVGAPIPGTNGTLAQTHRVGDRRFFIFPDPEVPVFEAPPTYDDALKHPQVPPGSNRTSAISGSTHHSGPSSSSSTSLASTPMSTFPLLQHQRAFDNQAFAPDIDGGTPGSVRPHSLPLVPMVSPLRSVPVRAGAPSQPPSGSPSGGRRSLPATATTIQVPGPPPGPPSPNYSAAVQTDSYASSISSSSLSRSSSNASVSGPPPTAPSGLGLSNPLNGILSWARHKVSGAGRGGHSNVVVTPISVGVEMSPTNTQGGEQASPAPPARSATVTPAGRREISLDDKDSEAEADSGLIAALLEASAEEAQLACQRKRDEAAEEASMQTFAISEKRDSDANNTEEIEQNVVMRSHSLNRRHSLDHAVRAGQHEVHTATVHSPCEAPHHELAPIQPQSTTPLRPHHATVSRSPTPLKRASRNSLPSGDNPPRAGSCSPTSTSPTTATADRPPLRLPKPDFLKSLGDTKV